MAVPDILPSKKLLLQCSNISVEIPVLHQQDFADSITHGHVPVVSTISTHIYTVLRMLLSSVRPPHEASRTEAPNNNPVSSELMLATMMPQDAPSARRPPAARQRRRASVTVAEVHTRCVAPAALHVSVLARRIHAAEAPLLDVSLSGVLMPVGLSAVGPSGPAGRTTSCRGTGDMKLCTVAA